MALLLNYQKQFAPSVKIRSVLYFVRILAWHLNQTHRHHRSHLLVLSGQLQVQQEKAGLFLQDRHLAFPLHHAWQLNQQWREHL